MPLKGAHNGGISQAFMGWKEGYYGVVDKRHEGESSQKVGKTIN